MGQIQPCHLFLYVKFYWHAHARLCCLTASAQFSRCDRDQMSVKLNLPPGPFQKLCQSCCGFLTPCQAHPLPRFQDKPQPWLPLTPRQKKRKRQDLYLDTILLIKRRTNLISAAPFVLRNCQDVSLIQDNKSEERAKHFPSISLMHFICFTTWEQWATGWKEDQL